MPLTFQVAFAVTNIEKNVWRSGLLPSVAPDEDCWVGYSSQARSRCCLLLEPGCFDELFTPGRCCGKCLPLTEDTAAYVAMFSSGLNARRLSAAAMPTACTHIGMHPHYVLLRARSVALPGAVSPNLEHILKDAPQATLYPTERALQSTLVCVPEGCWSQDDVRLLAAFVGQRPIPALLAGSWLHEPELLYATKLDALQQRIQSQRSSHSSLAAIARKERSLGLRCSSGGCAQLVGFAGHNSSAQQLGSEAVIVVDVGAGDRSEYMEWLKADDSHWLIALEPDPDKVARHPHHPRLALLEAAVGIEPGTSELHLASDPHCSSLLPLPVEPWAIGSRVDCFSYAEDGARTVEVSVVTLAQVFAQLPGAQEVALVAVDAQGTDVIAILSAADEIWRVRAAQLELYDWPIGSERLPYGRKQIPKEEAAVILAEKLGLLLEACITNNPTLQEEDCLFLRSDLLEARPSKLDSALWGGIIRWDRPTASLDVWAVREQLAAAARV